MFDNFTSMITFTAYVRITLYKIINKGRKYIFNSLYYRVLVATIVVVISDIIYCSL